jgi:hypothetical protein
MRRTPPFKELRLGATVIGAGTTHRAVRAPTILLAVVDDAAQLKRPRASPAGRIYEAYVRRA